MTYRSAVAALATMHNKARAIARPLHVATGLTVRVTHGLDTDALGTFTGERPRVDDARTTAVDKARRGMVFTGLPIGLASEGTFGPHPVVPFVTAGYELLAFVDDVQGFTLVESRVSTLTNHAALERDDDEVPRAFLERTGFPSHALIVRPRHAAPGEALTKGVRDLGTLQHALARARAVSSDGVAMVETDMRAHQNPTRMREIGALAVQLARRLACPCPACATPGFGRVGTIEGLPCAWCGSPTPLVREERWGCVRCAHETTRPRADGRRAADPGECPRCNP
ncbi:MAG: hypothetical protein MUE41_13835 [Gemmatimonadaceae bacterium]|jgi:hypothetical protein|nr:hypothetical protein [Gemmatimonadaceae bacterium]